MVVRRALFRRWQKLPDQLADCANDGIFVSGKSAGSRMIGNLVVRADTGVGMGVGASGSVMWFNTIVQSVASGFNIGQSSANDLRNNISAFNGAYGIVASDAKFTQQDDNGLFNNASGSCTVCTPGTHSVLLDPKFVSMATGDYTLQPGSPMINVGIAVGVDRNGAKAGDFDGSAPDLGFWESP